MPQTMFDFSAYITDRTRDFTGREWVFAEIDAWLADPDAPRYFIITGEPGIGKTAIAARLAQIREPAAIHFCIARQADTVDPLNFARSLSHQLTRIEGFALDILEEQGVHVDVDINVQENYGQIIGVQLENLLVEAPSAAIAFNRAVLDPLGRLYADGFEQQLVIMVDALDEAVLQRGPESIVDLLANARGLPKGVRFLLTSRPEGTVLRHFERLSIPHLVLDAGREENLQDVQSYIWGRLTSYEALQARLAEQEMSLQAFVERVAEASRGNFLYLVWLLRTIAEGTQRFDTLEALPEGLDGIYREFLRTRPVGRELRRWREHYRPLLGTLAAAQEPLTAGQLAHLAGLNRQSVQDALLDVQQFMDPIGAGENRYQLYHQSLINFLGNEERAGEFWVDLVQVHGQIAAYYQKHYAHRWPDCDLYGLRYLPVHLAAGKEVEALRKLLFDFSWLQAKLDATGINSLIADFDLLLGDAEVGLVQGALRLSSHVLTHDKTQLAGQLLGRMLSQRSSKVQMLLVQARQWKDIPWLRPLTSSLVPPGGHLLRTLTGHISDVNSIVITPDGHHAISGSSDKTVKVWNLESGIEESCLPKHIWWVNAVAVTPDGQHIISASQDILRVWDLKSGVEVHTLRGHTDWVQAVAVTPDGRCAISASSDKTLRIWDLARGEELLTLPGHTDEVRAVVVTLDGQRAISTSNDHTLAVWDLERGKRLLTLCGHTGEVWAVAVTPDNQHAVSASSDGTLIVWDITSGEELFTLRGHTSIVTGVAVTPDGRFALSSSYDATLRVWSLEDGMELATLRGHTGPIRAVAMTTDGRRAVSASGDHTLKVWDLESTTENSQIPLGHTDRIDSLAITEDGRILLSASHDETLKVWDLEKLVELHALHGHTGGVTAVAITQNQQYALSASSDCTIKVWDLKNGTELYTLSGHTDCVNAVAVTPDSQYAISASGSVLGVPSDKSLKVWDLEAGAQLLALSHAEPVYAVAVTPDGGRAVSAAGSLVDDASDYTLKVWDLKNGVELHTLRGHTGFITGVVITPDGKHALSTSDDDTLKVWDLESGREVYTLSGHTGCVYAAAVTPDGQQAISASGDHTLKVWSLGNGEEVRTLRSHTSSVFSVAVASDGQRVISSSDDHTLKVWDLNGGQVIASFSGDGPLRTCAVAPGTMNPIVAGEQLGRVHILRLEGIV